MDETWTRAPGAIIAAALSIAVAAGLGDGPGWLPAAAALAMFPLFYAGVRTILAMLRD